MKMKRDTAILVSLIVLAVALAAVILFYRGGYIGNNSDEAETAEAAETAGTITTETYSTSNELVSEQTDAVAEDGTVTESDVEVAEEIPVVDTQASVEQGFAPDDVVFSIGESGVTWRELAYWLTYNRDFIEYYYGEIEDWSEIIEEDTSLADYLLVQAIDDASLYHAVEEMCRLEGIELTDEIREEIETVRDEDIEYYGGEDEYIAALAESGLTSELFYHMNELSGLYKLLLSAHYGEDCELVTDEEILDYADYLGYMCARHILLQFPDDVTDEQKEELYAQMESILDELNSAEDVNAEFGELLDRYNEDEGEESYPDGYTFASGEMVSEFEDATAELDVYGVSGIVESDYGYHIIQRMPVTIDGLTMDGSTLEETLRAETAQALLENEIYVFEDECELTYSDALSTIDVAAMLNEKG